MSEKDDERARGALAEEEAARERAIEAKQDELAELRKRIEGEVLAKREAREDRARLAFPDPAEPGAKFQEAGRFGGLPTSSTASYPDGIPINPVPYVPPGSPPPVGELTWPQATEPPVEEATDGIEQFLRDRAFIDAVVRLCKEHGRWIGPLSSSPGPTIQYQSTEFWLRQAHR